MANTSERLPVGEVLRALDDQIDPKLEVAEVFMTVGNDRGAGLRRGERGAKR